MKKFNQIMKTMIAFFALIAFIAAPAAAAGDNYVDTNAGNVVNSNADPSATATGGIFGSVNSGNTYGGEKNFVNQGGVPIPGYPAYLAQPKNGYAEMAPKDVLRFAKTFDISEYNDKFGIKIIIDEMNPVAKDEVLPTKVAFIGTGNPADDPEFPAERKEMAIITVIATQTNVTMAKIIKATAMACASVDADTAFIEGFGSDRKVNAHGWGIGLSYTAANVSRSGDAGQVATGGTGYSQGQANYHGYPWIQVHALRTVPSETVVE